MHPGQISTVAKAGTGHAKRLLVNGVVTKKTPQ